MIGSLCPVPVMSRDIEMTIHIDHFHALPIDFRDTFSISLDV